MVEGCPRGGLHHASTPGCPWWGGGGTSWWTGRSWPTMKPPPRLDQSPTPAPSTRHGVANTLAAAALARAAGVEPEAVRGRLPGAPPGERRVRLVLVRGACARVNSSKATNPHAAQASLCVRPVVWIAGVLSKGVSCRTSWSATPVACKAVVVIGTGHARLLDSLAPARAGGPRAPRHPGSPGAAVADASAAREPAPLTPRTGLLSCATPSGWPTASPPPGTPC
ncbi:hypothetical protein QJS66_05535 [Kocuria rhizophila]|nr:hypothetical protein QJS66_05535 [Kocuria rhizophila]